MLRLDGVGRWVKCGPWEPPKGSLVLDSEFMSRNYERMANRASMYAAIPRAVAAAKRASKNREMGQGDMMAMLDQLGPQEGDE